MDIQLTDRAIASIETDALVVVVFDGEPSGLPIELPAGDAPTKLYENVTLYNVHGVAAKRVMLIGGGKREKFGTFELRRVAGAAVRLLKPKQLANVTFVPNGVPNVADAVQVS